MPGKIQTSSSVQKNAKQNTRIIKDMTGNHATTVLGATMMINKGTLYCKETLYYKQTMYYKAYKH